MGGRAIPLAELAEDWLDTKAVSARSASGNSDTARRQDLARWGRTLRAARGEAVDESGRLDVGRDLAGITIADLSTDAILAALKVHRARYGLATVSRQLSTLRGLCRWAASRGHLAADPFTDTTLRVPTAADAEPRGFGPDDVAAMITVAGDPPANASSAWPARDQALIDLMAATGVRASEACALEVGDVSAAERPLLVIRRGTKSGKRREVPLPRHTLDRLEVYLDERRQRAGSDRALDPGPRRPLWVRNDGRPLSTDSLYHLIQRVARAAAVTRPADALVHALRHHFGLALALRGVPPATLQQLMGHADPRTTALYTRHAGRDLINALDDAGWL